MTSTHRQRWYANRKGNESSRNTLLLHPPIHPLLPHQHQHHPTSVPPQAQYSLHSTARSSSPLFQLSSSPSFCLNQHPISSSSIASAHTPPPPPSSTVHSSSSPLSATIHHPIPTRPHPHPALLLLQHEPAHPTPFDALGRPSWLVEEDEVEEQLDLDHDDDEREKKFDFYSSGGKSKVEQEGAVGANSDDDKGKEDEEAKGAKKVDVSVSLMKWDKRKVVKKGPLEVRQALAQKKALLSQTQPQPQKTSSSSGHAQADLESHQRPKFLAQDLALGSTLPLDPNSLLPLALAQINKPALHSKPHLPSPLIEDFYAISTSVLSHQSPTSSRATIVPPEQERTAFKPISSTVHLPPTSFSSISCAKAYLATEQLFSFRKRRRRVLGLEVVEMGRKGGEKRKSGKSSMMVLEWERLEEELKRKLQNTLVGWKI